MQPYTSFESREIITQNGRANEEVTMQGGRLSCWLVPCRLRTHVETFPARLLDRSAKQGLCVARVIRPGHPAKRDRQVTCATRSRWRATPGPDDPGHSPDDERAHSVDRDPLQSALKTPHPEKSFWRKIPVVVGSEL